MNTRTCKVCNQEKQLKGFYKSKTFRDGYTPTCKKCIVRRNAVNRKGKERRPDTLSKTAKRIGKYDKDYLADWYNKQFKKQKGCCAICGIHQSELGKALSIDHDHNTKELRGLLCNSCNIGIGYLRHDAELCVKAYNYLRIGD